MSDTNQHPAGDSQGQHPCYMEIIELKNKWRKGEITNEEFVIQSDLIRQKYFPNNGVSPDEKEQLQKAKDMFGGREI